MWWCKPCHNSSMQSYKARTPERTRLRAKLWARSKALRVPGYANQRRLDNIEKFRAYEKQYREKNREKLRLYFLDYCRSHPERSAAWTKAHKAYRSEYMKRYYQEHKQQWGAYTDAYKARKAGAGGSYTGGSYTSYDVENLLVEQNGRCVYCLTELVRYHADHIIPLTRGGTSYIKNMQLLCPSCNMRKKNKLPEEYAQYLRRVSSI